MYVSNLVSCNQFKTSFCLFLSNTSIDIYNVPLKDIILNTSN